MVRVGDVELGGTRVVVIAGPCSVESRGQIVDAAHAVRTAGARLLRGGAFKPRSSPHVSRDSARRDWSCWRWPARRPTSRS